MTEPIRTVEEFIAWTKELHGGLFLYRGLADAGWEVESSAYRRIRKSEDLSSKTVPAVTFKNYTDRLLDEAGLQGFRERQDRRFSDLELLAELQHFGAATCLIDFTTSALIALWFACQEEEGNPPGKVVAMATDSIERFSTIRYEDLDKPIKEFLNQGKLWKWEPSGLNNRIVAQQSVFVFGEGRIEKSHYEEITIAADCKKDIVETLEKSFGIRGPKLFNDLAGFARHNGHDQLYDKFSAEDFFDLGISFHQRGEYQQAIKRINKAIELNPRNAVFYNNRATTKSELGDSQGAIADLDMAIELNPQDPAPVLKRGNIKSFSGDHQGALADYSRLIELNPQDDMAYFSRGNAKKTLGDIQGAIADYNIAIESRPREAMNYFSRGNAKYALGDLQGAIADYDKAIELGLKIESSYISRGNAKCALGDLQGAIADYDKAIELNPHYVDAYNNRGVAKRALGNEAGAKEDFARVNEIDPGLHSPDS